MNIIRSVSRREAEETEAPQNFKKIINLYLKSVIFIGTSAEANNVF